MRDPQLSKSAWRLCLCGVWGLVGCTHLHRPADHEQVQKAQKAFEEASLDTAFDEERALYDTLAEQELAALRREMTSRRDRRLYRIVANDQPATDEASGWQILLQEISDRRLALGLPNCQSARARAERTQRSFDRAETAYRIATLGKKYSHDGKERRYPAASCRMKPLPPDTPHAALLARILSRCEPRKQAQAALDVCLAGNQDGEYARSLAAQRALEAQQKQIRQALSVYQQRYAKALKDYEDLRKASEKNELKDALTNAARKARKALDAYEKADVAVPHVDKVLGELKIDGFRAETELAKLDDEQALLDTLIDGIIKGESPTQDQVAPQAAGLSARNTRLLFAIAVDVPNLFDQVSNALDRTQLSSLLLAYEQNQIRRQQIQGRVKRAQKALSLYKQKVKLIAKEAKILDEAYVSVCGILNCPDASELQNARCFRYAQRNALWRGLKTGPKQCRESLARALVRYADSWTQGLIEAEALEHALLQLSYEAQLDESTYAVMMWNRLIAVPLGQLAALHAGGVKLEVWVDILAAIATAAGLGAIAAGVQ